jgi:hypothetical protein
MFPGTLIENSGTFLLMIHRSQRVGQAEDVALAFLFAMQNPYPTGQVLFLDGVASIS